MSDYINALELAKLDFDKPMQPVCGAVQVHAVVKNKAVKSLWQLVREENDRRRRAGRKHSPSLCSRDEVFHSQDEQDDADDADDDDAMSLDGSDVQSIEDTDDVDADDDDDLDDDPVDDYDDDDEDADDQIDGDLPDSDDHFHSSVDDQDDDEPSDVQDEPSEHNHANGEAGDVDPSDDGTDSSDNESKDSDDDDRDDSSEDEDDQKGVCSGDEEEQEAGDGDNESLFSAESGGDDEPLDLSYFGINDEDETSSVQADEDDSKERLSDFGEADFEAPMIFLPPLAPPARPNIIGPILPDDVREEMEAAAAAAASSNVGGDEAEASKGAGADESLKTNTVQYKFNYFNPEVDVAWWTGPKPESEPEEGATLDSLMPPTTPSRMDALSTLALTGPDGDNVPALSGKVLRRYKIWCEVNEFGVVTPVRAADVFLHDFEVSWEGERSIRLKAKENRYEEIKYARWRLKKPSVIRQGQPTVLFGERLRRMSEPGVEPIVFFDITLGGESLGRIKMQLFYNTVPKTAENFRQFCIGEMKTNGRPTGYKSCRFHRVIPKFMIQGGDFINGDGTGCISIYGKNFADESFQHKHDAPGLLSMANSGPNSNGCQFFITTVPCPFLDDKHVVFGKVVDGMDVVHKIENTRTKGEKPINEVSIVQCGEM